LRLTDKEPGDRRKAQIWRAQIKLFGWVIWSPGDIEAQSLYACNGKVILVIFHARADAPLNILNSHAQHNLTEQLPTIHAMQTNLLDEAVSHPKIN
jgi:hypothetical protein